MICQLCEKREERLATAHLYSVSSVCVEDGGADGEMWAVVANDAFEDQGVQQRAVEEGAGHGQRG